MEDVITCPICNGKLRTLRLIDKYHHVVNKTANYIERTCSQGMNHSLQLLTDETTGQVDFIKISLNHKYSRFIEIDFINQKSRISCMKAGKAEYIDVDKIWEPDFPNLTKLKEKVALFITFS